MNTKGRREHTSVVASGRERTERREEQEQEQKLSTENKSTKNHSYTRNHGSAWAMIHAVNLVKC